MSPKRPKLIGEGAKLGNCFTLLRIQKYLIRQIYCLVNNNFHDNSYSLLQHLRISSPSSDPPPMDVTYVVEVTMFLLVRLSVAEPGQFTCSVLQNQSTRSRNKIALLFACCRGSCPQTTVHGHQMLIIFTQPPKELKKCLRTSSHHGHHVALSSRITIGYGGCASGQQRLPLHCLSVCLSG